MTEDRTTPRQIRQSSPRELEITWGDGRVDTHDVVELRRACRCARCIDEWSGEQLLRPEQVADTVRPVRIEPTGRYAITIEWSEGHSSGIYTFDYLRALADDRQKTEGDPSLGK